MQRFTLPRVFVLSAALLAAILAYGCVKKAPTELDPSFVPAGMADSAARLIANAALPSTIQIYLDLPPVGVDPNDPLVGTEEVYRYNPGSNVMMLMDQTPASKVEALRREGNGAWNSYQDFFHDPTRKWLESESQAFVIVDEAPSGFTPATYLLRGIVDGVVTARSPISNPSVLADRIVDNVFYTGISAPADSQFTVSWVDVPNAVGYWIHVYQFLEARQSDQIASGVPQALYLDKNRDFYLCYLPAPATSYKLGSPNAEIITTKVMLRGQVYLVRVSAVNADGRLIAYTYGDFGVAFAGDGYSLFPLGAKAINVRSGEPQLAPASAVAETPVGIDMMMGDLPIVVRR